jgi:IS30 family transposase
MRMTTAKWCSPAERAELWQRWHRGERIADIARALDHDVSRVRGVLFTAGGCRPRQRKRSALRLSVADREEISRGLSQGGALRAIAQRLGRPASTISREVARNGGRTAYRAVDAEDRAGIQLGRPQSCKLATKRALRRVVATKLTRFWSPEQIAAWLRLQYPDDSAMQISHETIYRSLFIQARGVLKAELRDYLRSGRRIRRGRPAAKSELRGTITDAVSIRQRPAEAEDRAVPGHWEGDLLAGNQRSHIATLVERASRFTLLVKVNSRSTEDVIEALIKQMRKLPVELRRSLTWDRGKELSQHKRFTLATDLKVYFCDPQSPWQRGSNENTNGLLRQYFPKGDDLAHYTQAQLNRVAREVNDRPRKTLGWRSPAATLAAALR